MPQPIRLAAIYRHAVKSLGSESLEAVGLATGAALPGDRRYAVEHGRSDLGDVPIGWADCKHFVRVANVPALARVTLGFDPDSETLTLHDGGIEHVYALGTAEGRSELAEWIGIRAAPTVPGPHRLLSLANVSFSDYPDQAPSLMSLASLRDLSERVGAALDPRRFRGNLWIDGAELEPWAELGWIGREIRIGEATLRASEPIERCRATAADPETGGRSHDPLPVLKAMNPDPLFGVIAHVVEGGKVALGDSVEPV